MVNPSNHTPLAGLELVADVVWSTDPAKIQVKRRETGAELAAYLLDGTPELVEIDGQLAMLNADTGELIEDRTAAFAALLAWGADPANHAAGILDADDGKTFWGGMALWKPSLRIDPNWMETMRRRSRGRAREAMAHMLKSLTTTEKAARRYGWRQRLTLKLVTMTMPHHAGKTSVEEVQRLNMAMTLLKKRDYWQGRMAGGVKGVEDALDADGPHVHAHLLMLSTYLDRVQLTEEWRECLDVATRKLYGFGLAEECSPFLDIRQIRRRGTSDDESVSLDDALNEVTKYVTKPAVFMAPDKNGRRIPREVILDLCEVRRWPRMFELLGRARMVHKSVQVAQDVAELALAATAALDLIHRAYSTRELPVLPPGSGWELVEGWDHEVDGPEEKRKLITAAIKARERGPTKRPRPPSWRDLLDVLGLPEWLRIMRERVERGRRFRINQILDANPSAYLVRYDGRAFGSEPCIVGV